MTEKGYSKLKERLITDLTPIFRTVSDCEEINDKSQDEIGKLKLDFAEGKTKLNIVIAILSTIAVPVIAVCIKELFGA